jgi:hypothetical protein
VQLTFRSKKLLDLARGQACVMCDCEDGTIVSAHSNLLEHGKGKGLKAHDGMIAWLCMRCHSELDQGRSMSKEERRVYMLEAICKTYMRMWDKELLTVKGLR